MIAVDPARRRWPNVAAAVGTRSTTQCLSHAQKYFKKLRRAAKKRRAVPTAPAPAPVVTDSDSSLDVSSTSRSPRPCAPPQADYAAVPTPPVQPRAGSFDDSLSPTSALLREPIVDDRDNAALTVDDAPPARWRGGAGSSPLDGASTAASSPRNDLVKNCRVQPTHWLISTQPAALVGFRFRLGRLGPGGGRLGSAGAARPRHGKRFGSALRSDGAEWSPGRRSM